MNSQRDRSFRKRRVHVCLGYGGIIWRFASGNVIKLRKIELGYSKRINDK
ncbi:MAG: hypothetical protein L3V56_08790 [Candidatus Magnetoovum sp. WYHC-5]|nr:hypothetical protein [Candidatus Magnetoovum sp. WYHC-5]